MEENKDFKAEEITKENQSAVEENELVTEDTEATSKEEAEEIVEEYTENDDLKLTFVAHEPNFPALAELAEKISKA